MSEKIAETINWGISYGGWSYIIRSWSQ